MDIVLQELSHSGLSAVSRTFHAPQLNIRKRNMVQRRCPKDKSPEGLSQVGNMWRNYDGTVMVGDKSHRLASDYPRLTVEVSGQ